MDSNVSKRVWNGRLNTSKGFWNVNGIVSKLIENVFKMKLF